VRVGGGVGGGRNFRDLRSYISFIPPFVAGRSCARAEVFRSSKREIRARSSGPARSSSLISRIVKTGRAREIPRDHARRPRVQLPSLHTGKKFSSAIYGSGARSTAIQRRHTSRSAPRCSRLSGSRQNFNARMQPESTPRLMEPLAT